MSEASGVPRGQGLLVALAGTAAAVGITTLFFPGMMSVDSVTQYSQAIGRLPLNDYHPPVMTLLWRALMAVVPNAGALLIFHQALYWLALVVLALSLAQSLAVRLLLLLGLGLWPPLLLQSLALWKDIGMLAAYMAVVGAVVADWRRPSLGWIVLAIAALCYGTAVRYNALPAAVPLAVLIAVRLAARFPAAARWRGAVIAVATIAILLAAAALNAVCSLGAQRSDHVAQTTVWDIAAVSLAVGKNLLPPYLEMVEPGEPLAILRSGFDPNRNVPTIAAVSATPPDLSGRLLADWLTIARAHPEAYLAHRLHVTARLLGLTPSDVYFPYQAGIAANDAGLHFAWLDADRFATVNRCLYLLTLLPIWRPWPYLVFELALVGAIALRRLRRQPIAPLHAVAAMTALSGIALFLPLVVIAPAADYRYVVWVVASGMLSLVLLLAARNKRTEASAGTSARPLAETLATRSVEQDKEVVGQWAASAISSKSSGCPARRGCFCGPNTTG